VDVYRSMIPRFNPMMAACVRSLAFSFERMLLTRPLTVSSVTPRHQGRDDASGLLDRFGTAAGFCDQGHVRLDADESGDAMAHERMVVDRENPDGRAAAAHDPLLSFMPRFWRQTAATTRSASGMS
jgi:hypothetical protein